MLNNLLWGKTHPYLSVMSHINTVWQCTFSYNTTRSYHTATAQSDTFHNNYSFSNPYIFLYDHICIIDSGTFFRLFHRTNGSANYICAMIASMNRYPGAKYRIILYYNSAIGRRQPATFSN